MRCRGRRGDDRKCGDGGGVCGSLRVRSERVNGVQEAQLDSVGVRRGGERRCRRAGGTGGSGWWTGPVGTRRAGRHARTVDAGCVAGYVAGENDWVGRVARVVRGGEVGGRTVTRVVFRKGRG